MTYTYDLTADAAPMTAGMPLLCSIKTPIKLTREQQRAVYTLAQQQRGDAASFMASYKVPHAPTQNTRAHVAAWAN